MCRRVRPDVCRHWVHSMCVGVRVRAAFTLLLVCLQLCRGPRVSAAAAVNGEACGASCVADLAALAHIVSSTHLIHLVVCAENRRSAGAVSLRAGGERIDCEKDHDGGDAEVYVSVAVDGGATLDSPHNRLTRSLRTPTHTHPSTSTSTTLTLNHTPCLAFPVVPSRLLSMYVSLIAPTPLVVTQVRSPGGVRSPVLRQRHGPVAATLPPLCRHLLPHLRALHRYGGTLLSLCSPLLMSRLAL